MNTTQILKRATIDGETISLIKRDDDFIIHTQDSKYSHEFKQPNKAEAIKTYNKEIKGDEYE